MAVAEALSYDGWYAWRVMQGGLTLDDHRRAVDAARPLSEEVRAMRAC